MQHKDDMVRCRLHTYVLSRLLPPQSRKPFANGLLSIFNCVICNATRSRHVIYRWTVAPPPVRFSTTLNTGRSDAVRIGKYVKYRFSDVSVYYNVNIDSFIVSFVSFCIQDSVLTRAGSRWKRLDWPRTAPSQALGLVLGLDSPEIYCTKFIIKNWSPWTTNGDNRMPLWSLVLTRYQRVTDGHTDTYAAHRCALLPRIKYCSLPNTWGLAPGP